MKKVAMKRKMKELMKNKRFKYIFGGVLCVLALVVVIRLFLLVFPVKEFEISGDTHYNINEIIDGSQIRTGQRLYGINKSKAEKRLMESCPYIKSVEIKQKFPNKICFEIEERVAGWYVQVGDDFYALDYDLKVLLETFDEESLKMRGLTKLVLPELETVICGEYPKFGNGDEHLISETLKIIDTVRTHRIKERLTYLDLQNRFEMKLTVDGTYRVNFGDINDSDTKFALIEGIIDNSVFSGYNGGEINVINPLLHTFKGEKVNMTDKDAVQTDDEDEEEDE